MRCRKVRSCLSAYSNDELTGRRQLAIREHLSICSDCRKEAAFYSSMSSAGKQLTGLTVTAEFNTRLLDRIGLERFKETRTRAYLPRRVPVVGWRQVVPALSVVAVLALVAVYWYLPGAGVVSQNTASSEDPTGDLYLTVQPTDNPNMTAPMRKDWSLNKQLRWSDRMARISNSITDQTGFGNLHLTGEFGRRGIGANRYAPYISTYYRVQPIIRIYQSPNRTRQQEDDEIY